MRKTAHGFSVKGLILFLAIAGIIAVVYYCINNQAMQDYFTSLGYEPTPELDGIISDDEYTSDGKLILYASRPELQEPEDFNATCYTERDSKNSSVLGCYKDRKIYVYNITDKELEGIRETVLAHELLHAVWDRMSNKDRKNLEDDLENAYQANLDSLHDHMKGYTSEEYFDELHSIIGTQLPASAISTDLADHYAKYFANRNKIVSFYGQYNGKFEELEKNASELAGQIDEKRAEIETKTAQYQADATALSRDIEVFNRRANSGDFASQADFQAERSELLNRQERLNADYEALSALINETNDIIEQYNNNVAASNKLYDTVNSRVNQSGNSISE